MIETYAAHVITPVPVETVSYFESSIMCSRVSVSPRKGDFYVLDRLEPHLQPTIFMTQRNADRRAAPTSKKSLFKKLFSFLW
jgi:hypothetical protein